MAKPPVDTYQKMITFLQSQLRKKRFVENYQPVMIKLLLLEGNQTKKQIANALWKANENSKKLSHYIGVPVYGVLEENGIVNKNGDVFSLVLQNISDSEKQTLRDELESCISRQKNFSKTGFLSWPEAKIAYQKIVSDNNIKNQTELKEFLKNNPLPDNLPSNPSVVYSKENILKQQDNKT